MDDLEKCREKTRQLTATIQSLQENQKGKKAEKNKPEAKGTSKSSGYEIESIEGIGPVIGGKLKNIGIRNTNDFLENSKTPAQRKKLAASSGLTEKQVLKFANMIDLLRIDGVGPQFAELLEASGVDTIAELAQRRADNLAKKMEEVNAVKKLCKKEPSEDEVNDWISQAKKLPRVIEY